MIDTSWNNFSLDLSKMIKSQPGAIYRVMISFKMSQSLYPCDCDDGIDKELSSVEKEIKTILKGEQAVLCWQKNKDTYISFFIVWW